MHCSDMKFKYYVEKLDECVTFSRNSSIVCMYFGSLDTDKSRNNKIKHLETNKKGLSLR